jgi:hypothetical protein
MMSWFQIKLYFENCCLSPQLQPKTRQRCCSPQAGRCSNLSSGCLGCRLQGFRCHCRVVKQVSIGGRDRQTPSDYNSTADLLNALNLPAPTRSTVMKVAGNGVPRAVGQGGVALLSGLEVPRINGTGQVRQGFGSRAERELDGSGCLSAVA